MLLFSLVVWSRDSWWLFTTHSAVSLYNWLLNIYCVGEVLLPHHKHKLLALENQLVGKKDYWSHWGSKDSSPWQHPLEPGLRDVAEHLRETEGGITKVPWKKGWKRLEPFWHIAAFCTITLPSVVRLSLASEQNTCSSGQELSLVYHSPLKPRHMCRLLSALQMFVVNWHLQFLTSRCDKDNC